MTRSLVACLALMIFAGLANGVLGSERAPHPSDQSVEGDAASEIDYCPFIWNDATEARFQALVDAGHFSSAEALLQDDIYGAYLWALAEDRCADAANLLVRPFIEAYPKEACIAQSEYDGGGMHFVAVQQLFPDLSACRTTNRFRRRDLEAREAGLILPPVPRMWPFFRRSYARPFGNYDQPPPRNGNLALLSNICIAERHHESCRRVGVLIGEVPDVVERPDLVRLAHYRMADQGLDDPSITAAIAEIEPRLSEAETEWLNAILEWEFAATPIQRGSAFEVIGPPPAE